MEKLKVAGVSYLNTKPYLYGIKKSMLNEVEISVDHPSKLADQLLANKIDIALIPVSTIPLISNSRIISDYCIGCNGAVASVVICSEVPIESADNIYMDYQSRTSVQLSKVLLNKFMQLHPNILNTNPGFEEKVKGKSAGLFIGDRALVLKKHYEYVYDLGSEWKKFTSMPFVFACWVTSKNISSDFETAFNNALAFGLQNLDHVIAEEQKYFPEIDVHEYLSGKIQYALDDEKKEALKYFYKLSGELQ